MPEDTLNRLSLDTMIDHIARGHAFTKHVLGEDRKQKMRGRNAFTDEHDNNGNELGPDLKIKTVLDLRHYINEFIDDEHTSGFVKSNDGAIVLFNSRDKVIVHFTPNDKKHDYGSAYRYDTSPADFERMHEDELFDPTPNGRHPYRVMDNYLYPGAVRGALDDMIAGLQGDPQKYTARPETRLTEARFLIALGNENRPGRRDVQGAGNNGILHSVEYAETHQRNIFGPPNVNRPGVVVALDDYRSVDDGFELTNLLKEKLDIGDDIQDYAEPGMM